MDLRIESASRLFLDVPYMHDPVGEGPGADFDPRPVIRFDRFDCQTFIETVLALAYARRHDEVDDHVRAFRYSGPCSFAHRNQFITSQWLPNVIARGLLIDDTRRVAGDMATEVETSRPVLRARLVDHARTVLSTEHQAAARAAIESALPRRVTLRRTWLPVAAFVREDRPFVGGKRVRGLHLNTRLLARIQPGSVLVTRSPRWVHLAIAVQSRGRWWIRQANASRGSVQQYDMVSLLMTMWRFELCTGIAVLRPRSS